MSPYQQQPPQFQFERTANPESAALEHLLGQLLRHLFIYTSLSPWTMTRSAICRVRN